jgi:hypothetical protein
MLRCIASTWLAGNSHLTELFPLWPQIITGHTRTLWDILKVKVRLRALLTEDAWWADGSAGGSQLIFPSSAHSVASRLRPAIQQWLSPPHTPPSRWPQDWELLRHGQQLLETSHVLLPCAFPMVSGSDLSTRIVGLQVELSVIFLLPCRI